MNSELLSMAFHALIANKTRSALSMLGIIIGVSTVIAVVGIGLGAQKQVSDQFKNLSVTTLMAFPSRGGNASSKLEQGDLDKVLSEASLIEKGTAMYRGNGDVSAEGNSGSYTVMGTPANFFDYSNLDFIAGEPFSPSQADNRGRVVVLGYAVAAELFGEGFDPASLLGETVAVAGKKMDVIGVLESNGRSAGFLSYDDSVFIPYSTAEKVILGDRGSVTLFFNAYTVEELTLAQEELTQLLRANHRLKASQEDDFSVRDPGSMVASAEATGAALTFLLTAVSAIVLLVSGIGIMNVMFVTVAERTKEIGVLKAIGAKQKDILTQFLLEAVMLSTLGGLIGVVLGNGVIPFLKDYQAMYSVQAIVLGFSFSVFVGIFFGFYPAFKASRLDPVDALRSE
ncbi:ABC transporter permease [Candidatus Gracilibacteria bacterium]|nr:ABC transporter permease [Candidatus Gracilibacteria bacterium]